MTYKLQFYFSCRLSENRRAKREGSGTDRAACVCGEQERSAGTVRGLTTSTVSRRTFVIIVFNIDSKDVGVRIKEDNVIAGFSSTG